MLAATFCGFLLSILDIVGSAELVKLSVLVSEDDTRVRLGFSEFDLLIRGGAMLCRSGNSRC